MSEESTEQPPENVLTPTETSAVATEQQQQEAAEEEVIVLNRSRVEKFMRALLGPKARVWRRNGRIQLGVEGNGHRWLVGEGDTWEEALQDAAREAKAVAAEATAEALRVAKMNEAAREKPPRVGEATEGTEVELI